MGELIDLEVVRARRKARISDVVSDRRSGAREATWGHERPDRFDGVRIAREPDRGEKTYLTVITWGSMRQIIPPTVLPCGNSPEAA